MVNSTQGIVVIFAQEFHKQRAKRLMERRSHNLRKPLWLLQPISKANLVHQVQLQIMTMNYEL